MLAVASILLVLSGIAALTYQVVWMRLLRLVLGSTSVAVATVVAAFFVGMALGSWIAPRLRRRDLSPYLILEILIAISGAILLPVLLRLGHWIPSALADGIAPRFLISWALLVVPTACMGATFPFLVAWVGESSKHVSVLYAWNTFGAVLGALAAGFWFIPQYGLDGATRVAVGLNLLVVLLAVPFRRRPARPPSAREEAMASPRSSLALWVLVMTGAVSIACEVAWTRLLGMSIGGTIFGFSSILALFLFGITVGSAVVRLFPPRDPHAWLGLGCVALAASILSSRALLGWVPGPDAGLAMQVGSMWLVLLPSTLLFGALYPVAIDLYSGGSIHRLGLANALNLLAGVAGSIVAGFWVLPHLGSDVLLRVCGVFAILVSMLFWASGRARLVQAGGVVVAVGILGLGPGVDLERLVGSVRYEFDEKARAGLSPEVLYMREGRESLITLVSYDGSNVRLQANGLNESGLNPTDPLDASPTEVLLGWVPVLLRPEASSAFVVGFGGGVTARALLETPIDRVRVVELEPAIVDAVRFLLGERSGLDDSRLVLSFDDARHVLLHEPTRYDILVSQPSHPWLAGGATLFSREMFTLASSRLSPNGVFGQWLNLFGMDVTTIRTVVRAFFEVFSEGFVFADRQTGDLLLFGSATPLAWDPIQVDSRLASYTNMSLARTLGEATSRAILRHYAFSREEVWPLVQDDVANTDLNLKSETRPAAQRFHRRVLSTSENPYVWLDEHNAFDVGRLVVAPAVLDLVTGIARRAIAQNDRDGARLAIGRLHEIDATLARQLESELSVRARAGPGP